MKTALVCGGGAFIGSHLVKRPKREGFWVRAVNIDSEEIVPINQQPRGWRGSKPLVSGLRTIYAWANAG